MLNCGWCRFSLPDGSLTTYDTYPERCLPDGRVSPTFLLIHRVYLLISFDSLLVGGSPSESPGPTPSTQALTT